MTLQAIETPNPRLVRGLGLCLLLSLLIPLADWELVFARLIVLDDVIATARALLRHEQLFRLGIVVQAGVALGAMTMAVLMYRLLREVSPGLALLALALRGIEAALIAVLALLGFIAVQLLDRVAALGTVAAELLEGFVGLFLHGYMALWSVSMVFFGMGASLFFYLLRRSGHLPRIVGDLGVLSYLLVLAMGLLTLLAPDLAAQPVVQAIGYTPSVLFEALGGPWILLRGATLRAGVTAAGAPAGARR